TFNPSLRRTGTWSSSPRRAWAARASSTISRWSWLPREAERAASAASRPEILRYAEDGGHCTCWLRQPLRFGPARPVVFVATPFEFPYRAGAIDRNRWHDGLVGAAGFVASRSVSKPPADCGRNCGQPQAPVLNFYGTSHGNWNREVVQRSKGLR